MISGSVFSQRVTTPSGTDTIQGTLSSGGRNIFEVLPLNPSQTGAYFSHLWWSGDNDFSFMEVSEHVHKDTKGNPTFPKVKMTDITTENYGTGGPPPLTYSFTTDIGNTSSRQVLRQGEYIYVQNYRNAVIGDVMYLIVSYGNSTRFPLSGTLKFDLGRHAQIDNGILNDHPHFLSNGERWDANRDECSFRDLGVGEERSILVPVRILRNEEDKLEMRVDLFKGNSQENANQLGQDYFAISPSVAHSHDPNLMLQHSTAQNECDYRNGKIHYTVKFQNEGTGPTRYVRVECQLDNKVNLNSISGITFPDFYSSHNSGNIAGQLDTGAGAVFHIDHTNRVITFEMHDLKLETINDPNLTNLELARDQIEFDILVKSNYVFGPATVAVSEIFFDRNDSIETNEVQTVCGDPLEINNGGGFQRVQKLEKHELKQERVIIGN